jgi:hypothetical protein
VLREATELKRKAVLQADGFSDDLFARHVGHQVTVEGVPANDGEPMTLRVKKITQVADACTPE